MKAFLTATGSITIANEVYAGGSPRRETVARMRRISIAVRSVYWDSGKSFKATASFGKHRATRSRPAPLLSFESAHYVSGNASLALWRIVDKNGNYRSLHTHFESFSPLAALSDLINGPRRPLATLNGCLARCTCLGLVDM
jgi:hypothetical protein